jgi:hypothetical protein
VHQSCVRADLIAKIWDENDPVYDLPAIDNRETLTLPTLWAVVLAA